VSANRTPNRLFILILWLVLFLFFLFFLRGCSCIIIYRVLLASWPKHGATSTTLFLPGEQFIIWFRPTLCDGCDLMRAHGDRYFRELHNNVGCPGDKWKPSAGYEIIVDSKWLDLNQKHNQVLHERCSAKPFPAGTETGMVFGEPRDLKAPWGWIRFTVQVESSCTLLRYSQYRKSDAAKLNRFPLPIFTCSRFSPAFYYTLIR